MQQTAIDNILVDRRDPARRLAWPAFARRGAGVGAVAVVVYALLFMVYGVVRYTASLWAAPPDRLLGGSGLWSTWAIGLLSLFVSVVSVTLLMLIPAILLGSLTALVVAGLVSRFHAAAHPWRAMVFGGVVAVAVVLLVHMPLFQAQWLAWSGMASATYLFWLGLPSVIYVGVAIMQSRVLQHRLTA